MNNSRFHIGDKVMISGDHHWAANATGFVSITPFTVEDEPRIGGYYRFVKTLKGLVCFVWVRLDTLHLDGDGDGPYPEGEFEEEALEFVGREKDLTTK